MGTHFLAFMAGFPFPFAFALAAFIDFMPSLITFFPFMGGTAKPWLTITNYTLGGQTRNSNFRWTTGDHKVGANGGQRPHNGFRIRQTTHRPGGQRVPTSAQRVQDPAIIGNPPTGPRRVI